MTTKDKESDGKSVYDRHPQKWDELAAQGFVTLTVMAQTFRTCEAMAEALGLTGAAVSKWGNGINSPSAKMEGKAKKWLADVRHNSAREMPLFATAEAAPAAKKANIIVMASCETLQEADRAARALALVGCKVERF